jgi:hypothetical protein
MSSDLMLHEEDQTEKSRVEAKLAAKKEKRAARKIRRAEKKEHKVWMHWYHYERPHSVTRRLLDIKKRENQMRTYSKGRKLQCLQLKELARKNHLGGLRELLERVETWSERLEVDPNLTS